MVSESFEQRIPGFVPVRGLLTNVMLVIIGAGVVYSMPPKSEPWWMGLAFIVAFGAVVALYLRPALAPGEFDLVVDRQGLTAPGLLSSTHVDWIDVTKLGGFTWRSHGRVVMRAITVTYQKPDGRGQTRFAFNYNLLDAEPNEVLAALLHYAPAHVDTSALVREMNKLESKRGRNIFGRTQKHRRITP